MSSKLLRQQHHLLLISNCDLLPFLPFLFPIPTGNVQTKMCSCSCSCSAFFFDLCNFATRKSFSLSPILSPFIIYWSPFRLSNFFLCIKCTKIWRVLSTPHLAARFPDFFLAFLIFLPKILSNFSSNQGKSSFPSFSVIIVQIKSVMFPAAVPCTFHLQSASPPNFVRIFVNNKIIFYLFIVSNQSHF